MSSTGEMNHVKVQEQCGTNNCCTRRRGRQAGLAQVWSSVCLQRLEIVVGYSEWVAR